jgi:hypothetical protein
MAAPLFDLGALFVTPGAEDLLSSVGEFPSAFLKRHRSGDWDDVPPDDACENVRSLKYGWRVLASEDCRDGKTR